MSRIFGLYGELCARNPWEVIVAIITLTTCLLTVDRSLPTSPKDPACPGCAEDQFNAPDTVVMTLIRCLAILYSYHQLRNLQKIGSKYILGIAGLFTVFSSFVFMSTVLNVLKVKLVDLKDAIFFFLLLIDLSKATTLAQFALTASNQKDISKKISRGMAILGPTMTLDSVVEILVIGVGTLSGVHRLEMLSYYACLSVLVNYIIFMTFYPACLSLILELSSVSNFYGDNSNRIAKMLTEENDKANPAAQRVKLIMSLGLTVVHLYSYWTIIDESSSKEHLLNEATQSTSTSSTIYNYIIKQFTLSADHIVILIMLVTLMVKLIFFEGRDRLSERLDTETVVEAVTVPAPKRLRKLTESVEVQTEACKDPANLSIKVVSSPEPSHHSKRKLEECLQIYRANLDASSLSDEEVMLLVDTKHIPSYNLEKVLKCPERGVKIRRQIIQTIAKCSNAFTNLPYLHYDYGKVMGACCENVVGYVPVPLGLAGPLRLDDNLYYIPMATTEGCLVASTNRGCRAVEKSGIKSVIVADGMTRAPVVQFDTMEEAKEAMKWIESPENYALVKESFDSTSRFARLSKITMRLFPPYLYIRFVAETGDAMGMNMLSKGTEKALKFIKTKYPKMKVLSLSSNLCTDKKPSAVNWIEGRGKYVCCETVIPGSVVSSVLKTTTQSLVKLNRVKNGHGSEIAGSIGGFNAQASNIVTAIYIATGQDPAQNVGSSNCKTIMEERGENGVDLYISCTMPSVEVGTIGGGTILPAQSSCLELLGIKGPHEEEPGENARQLAKIVCGAVMAGELSLMAALVTGDLVKSHLQYNRSYDKSQISVDQGCN